MDDLPDLIRAYRDRHGLTQAALAARWQVPLQTLQGWEHGRRPAQPGMLACILREALAERGQRPN